MEVLMVRPTDEPQEVQTRLAAGTLGTSSIVFFVIAAAAPLLVMAGVAPLAIGYGGVGAPSGYLIAGVSLAILAAGFTAMTKFIHNAGAFYAYISRGLGPTAGIVAAVLALVSYNALEIGMFGALGSFAHLTIGSLTGLNVPWWVWALSGVAMVWFLGSRSIHVGAQFLIALLLAETGILVLLAVGVLIKGGADGLNLTSFTPAQTFTPQLGAVLAFAFAAFMGFESTALYREEAKQPDRTIPRATYIAVAFLGLFYGFMAWIIVVAYGVDNAQDVANQNPAAMYFNAMEHYVGGWARTLMEVLILTSIIASLLAFHNAITRYAYCLAREGILPQTLGELHPKHLLPHRASAWQSVLAAAVVAVFAALQLDPDDATADLGEHAGRDRHRQLAGDGGRGGHRVLPDRSPRVRRDAGGGRPRRGGRPLGVRVGSDYQEHRAAHRRFGHRERHPPRDHTDGRTDRVSDRTAAEAFPATGLPQRRQA
jgi:amino acid transporter